jgi:hypothetical protein
MLPANINPQGKDATTKMPWPVLYLIKKLSRDNLFAFLFRNKSGGRGDKDKTFYRFYQKNVEPRLLCPAKI